MTIVLMGVSGSGKTTIGQALANELGWRFVDGDDLHPAANVAKMAAEIPLEDADREPWLLAIRDLVQGAEVRGERLVVACSALKQAYRDLLEQGTQIRWAFLRGDPSLIQGRLTLRSHPFMTGALLGSQLEILETPRDALVVDIAPPVQEVVKAIRRGLGV